MPKTPKPAPIDGMSPKDLARIRTALRQVWSWSVMHRMVRARCKIDQDYARCELCGMTVPKVYVDHIEPCGDVLAPGYIERMFAPSVKLQGLCRKCHAQKTKQERGR